MLKDEIYVPDSSTQQEHSIKKLLDKISSITHGNSLSGHNSYGK